jgi:hypothetical protein
MRPEVGPQRRNKEEKRKRRNCLEGGYKIENSGSESNGEELHKSECFTTKFSQILKAEN